MPDEPKRRREGFLPAGQVVTLADGAGWTLPALDPLKGDPDLQALLRGYDEAEDRTEAHRAGLALTIHLLTRQYDLSPSELNALLSFPPGHPQLRELQAVVDGLARAAPRPTPVPCEPVPVSRWRSYGDRVRRWFRRV